MEVDERERRSGEWRSMSGLFKLKTIPPLVDTFKVSLLETTWIENVKDKIKTVSLRPPL